MAAATTPRNDVYLSFLAGRVLTALADLATDPGTWSEQIKKELLSGVEYCEIIRKSRPDLRQMYGGGGHQALRRLATKNGQQPSEEHAPSECDSVEQSLRDLIAQSRVLEPAEILDAIKFFAEDVGYLGS